MGGILEMSEKERDRLIIIKEVLSGRLTQVQAAKLLKITDRQVRNLLKSWKEAGDKGLVSKKRGNPSNHQFCKFEKQRILDIVRKDLEGFGPTLASEKLLELWKTTIPAETLRLWMIQEDIPYPSRKKKKRQIHKPRERRACQGELIQGDGSHHRWFGPDEEMYNLIVFIDDATGKLTALHFSKEETLEAYYKALKQHLLKYGRPRAFYTDRSAVAKTRQGDSITQFHKSLMDLDIELILANSPQAKGRVERVNRTLQDRLVKELQLRGIKTMEEANEFLPEFIEDFNKKFSKVPMSTIDAHRSLEGYDISTCLTKREIRTLTTSCIFQYQNTFFEVKGLAKTRNHKGRKVDLRVSFDGSFRVFLEGIEREVVESVQLAEPVQPKILSRKGLRHWKPGKNHPWRRWNPKGGPSAA